jgi:NOL1/NOP2/fmu family ribosome biogenesis protein
VLEVDSSHSGWVLVRANGLGLGWGKQVGARIKNHYPKHLRNTSA